MSIRSALLICSALACAAHADITTDGSLTGAAGPVPGDGTADYAITDDLGVRSGGNVFFSFGRFVVAIGEVAEFRAAALPTQNYVGRVTDASGATVAGTLRSTAGDTDIWLISPGGWAIGPGAELDVPAAIYLGTAGQIDFADGGAFYADATASSSLSVDAPVSFGFLGSAGALMVEGLDIAAGSGSVGLIGNEVTVSNLRNGSLAAPGTAHLQIVAAAAGETVVAGAVQAAPPGGALTLADSNVNVSGDGGLLVSVEGGAIAVSDTRLNATGTGTGVGQIAIRGGTVVVDTRSQISSSVPASSTGTRGVDVLLEASGELTFNGRLQSTARAVDSVSGDVRVAGADVSFNGATVDLSRAAPGRSGTFVVEATSTLVIADSDFGNVTSFGDGQIMEFRAPAIRFDHAFLQADTQDTDNGPGILMRADDLLIDNATVITADVERGRSPGITFDIANGMTVRNDSLVTTESFDKAVGGPITVSADVLELSAGGRLTSDVVLDGGGGTISIDVGSLVVSGAGDDTGIFARSGSFSFDPSALDEFVDHPDFALGNGGNIVVRADELSIGGGAIVVDTAGRGNAGAVDVAVTGNMAMDGTTAPSLVSGSATATFPEYGPDTLGAGGDVTVTAGALQLSGDATIRTDTDSNRLRGGSIAVSAGTLELSGDADTARAVIAALDQGLVPDSGFTGIVSDSSGAAQGGSIQVRAGQFGSRAGIVSASASGSGGGGDVRIGDAAAPVEVMVLDGSSGILARAQQGNGGNVFIFADQFIRDVNAVVSADSSAGNAGTVEVVAPDLDISAAITDLDAPILDASQLLQDACTPAELSRLSSLTLAGQGGLPVPPDALQPGVVTDERSPSTARPASPTVMRRVDLPCNSGGSR